MKLITVVGSTGSIGKQTLEVVRNHPDKFKIKGLIANSDYQTLVEQSREFHPDFIALTDRTAAAKLLISGYMGEILSPGTALYDCVTPDIDVIVVACSGINGLVPTLKAIECGIDVALANKETLVVGGELVLEKLSRSKSRLLPVDSEHSAIMQCLEGNARSSIKRIILTASGGAFRDYSKESLKYATARDALVHPNWRMGKKITIDCATLMNKGLEIIEASFLFGVDIDQVEPLIHRESIIHSMVEYNDGAIIAQMGAPSMILPIQYALTYPERDFTNVERLDFAKIATLNFSEPDRDRFPCLKIAEEVGRTGGLLRTVMNAANDAAVELYLKEKIGFYDIANIIEREVSHFDNVHEFSLSDVIECDEAVKRKILQNY